MADDQRTVLRIGENGIARCGGIEEVEKLVEIDILAAIREKNGIRKVLFRVVSLHNEVDLVFRRASGYPDGGNLRLEQNGAETVGIIKQCVVEVIVRFIHAGEDNDASPVSGFQALGEGKVLLIQFRDNLVVASVGAEQTPIGGNVFEERKHESERQDRAGNIQNGEKN